MSEAKFFPKTPWTIFSMAKEGSEREQDAARIFCESYRQPVLQYVISRGAATSEAEDIVHSFFVDFLGREPFQRIDPRNGLFRVYLCKCIRNFLYKKHREEQAQKRGGGAVHLPHAEELGDSNTESEDAGEQGDTLVFDRFWAQEILDRVWSSLREKYEARGRLEPFLLLQPLVSESGKSDISSVARELEMTEGTATVALHRLRKQFALEIEMEVEKTVADPGQVAGEVAYLKKVLSFILDKSDG